MIALAKSISMSTSLVSMASRNSGDSMKSEKNLRVSDHVLRLLEQPAAPALAHERERRLLADELAVLAQRHPRDGGVVEHRGVPGVGPRIRLQLPQALLERRAGGVEQRVADHLVVAALLVRGPLADDPPLVDVDLDVGRGDPHVEGHFLELDGAEARRAAGRAGRDAHEVELELVGEIELEAHVRGPGGGAGAVVLRVGLVVHADAAPQVLVPLDGAPEPDRHPVRLAQRERIERALPLRWNRLADDRCHRSPPACRRLAEVARIREVGPLMQFGNERLRTAKLAGRRRCCRVTVPRPGNSHWSGTAYRHGGRIPRVERRAWRQLRGCERCAGQEGARGGCG